MVATRLFTWIQGADFYHDLHAEAVAALPSAQNHELWIDVGCGPGLVTRLAAARGYRALGIDLDAGMVQAAQQIAAREGSSAAFRVGSVDGLPPASGDVISAASLLAVLPDPIDGLGKLWDGVRPGGTLLVIEPTSAMTIDKVRQLLGNSIVGKRKEGSYLWASARQGHTIDPSIYERINALQRRYLSLLDGLVGAWIFHKSETIESRDI